MRSGFTSLLEIILTGSEDNLAKVSRYGTDLEVSGNRVRTALRLAASYVQGGKEYPVRKGWFSCLASMCLAYMRKQHTRVYQLHGSNSW